jgi:hypothetical protein
LIRVSLLRRCFTAKRFYGTANDVVKRPPTFQVCIPRTLIQQRGKRGALSG